MTDTTYLGYDTVRLREVFNLVKTPGNWKEPIDALVPTSAATESEIATAVTFFTGGNPEITVEGPCFRVRDAGYYEHIGS